MYVNVAKTLRGAQILKVLDVSATVKGEEVEYLPLFLSLGKPMDHATREHEGSFMIKQRDSQVWCFIAGKGRKQML